MRGPTEADRDEIIHAAKLLVAPGGITELRALDAKLNGEYRTGTVSGYFDDAGKLADAVLRIDRAKGVYIVLNEADPALLSRAANRARLTYKDPLTSDDNIVRRRWLPIDLDAARPAGISATDAERAEAKHRAECVRDFLSKRGWPEPVFGDSGNGFHLLYRIDLAPDDEGVVARCLEALSARFSVDGVKLDTSVHNPARIWKLYGTVAAKGDSTPDRPHRLSRLVDVPEALAVVDESMLAAQAAENKPAATRAVSRARLNGTAGTFNLAEWIARHLPDATGPKPWKMGGEVWTLPTCPFNPEHTGGSAYVGRHPSGAIVAGCHHNSCGWTWPVLRAHFDPPEARRRDSRQHNAEPGAATPDAPAFTPFPVDALPMAIRSFVEVEADRKDCDPVFLAQPALAALAGAVGGAVAVVVRRGWAEPCAIWTAAVAPPSSMKSPGRQAAMIPVYRTQREADREHEAALDEHEAALFVYEAQRDSAKKAARAGKAVDPPAEPRRPARRQLVVGDATREALAHVLADNPRGVLVDRDELAGLLGGFGAYSKGSNGAEPDAAFYKSAWSGERFVENRKTGASYINVRPLLSIYGTIQPDALGPALGRQRIVDGLASRFLWTMPPDVPAYFPDEREGESDGHAATYSNVYARLCSLSMGENADGEPAPRVVGLMRDAQRIGRDWVNSNAERIVGEPDPALRAAYGKLKGYLFRLALVLHLIEWASSRRAEPGPVDVDAMRRAVALADWYRIEAARVYGMLGESDEGRGTRRLVELIRRKGGSVTARELMRSGPSFKTAGDADAALNELVGAGLGVWESPAPGPRGGRPTRCFKLTDGTDTDNTPRHDTANGGFVSVSSVSDPAHTGNGWGEL